MSVRHEFVLLAQQPDANLALLARRFGISRKTAYKWLRRYRTWGAGSLIDYSRRPHTSPARTSEQLEQRVLGLRHQHPAWGGRKLHARLLALGHAHVPSPSTITAILRRHGRLHGGPRAGQPRAWQRFEHACPNDLWQMDFKGHFGLTDGSRCHPLTVLDDHSRYALGLLPCRDETTATVRAALAVLFRRYGLPRRILMDNGPPWGGEPDLYTELTVWLLRLGVQVSHGRPRHPQTQGKDERFHRTFRAEVLAQQTFSSVPDCQEPFERWRHTYNHERPHEALRLAVPASRYRPSPRAMPTALPPITYDPSDIVRRVMDDGRFSYQGQLYRLARGFRGYPIALRAANGQQGQLGVWFCTHQLGTLDPHHRTFEGNGPRKKRE